MIRVGDAVEKNIAEYLCMPIFEDNIQAQKPRPTVMLIDMWDNGAGKLKNNLFLAASTELSLRTFLGDKELAVFLGNPVTTSDEELELVLLCTTPLIDDTSSSGDSQIETIDQALQNVGLTWHNILVLIADNTGVNPSIARK